jgi:hypothetical protein
MEAKNANFSRQQRARTRITSFVLVWGLPFLLYFGYCSGLWGRNSLLLQYLFQCNCPGFSEEWRYPKEVDVIVSACQNANIRISPSGRFLYVDGKSGFPSTYLLDLHTKEKFPFRRPDLPEGDFAFLTDDLIYMSGHIFDRTTNMLYPIDKYSHSHPETYVDGDPDLGQLAQALREVREIYFLDNTNIIVALTADSAGSFIAGPGDIPGFETNRVELFLQENQIAYDFIYSNYPGEVVSPDGKFTARQDGIYLNQNDRMVVRSHRGGVIGWADSGRGVIYASYHSGPCLIDSNFGFLDDSACFFEVSQPVLLLKVPEEYLSRSETQ